MKKIYLIKIIWLKEGVHWKRMGQLFKLVEGLLGTVLIYPFFVSLLSLFHYAFAGMHAMFEITMWMFNRNKFKRNMFEIYSNLQKAKS